MFFILLIIFQVSSQTGHVQDLAPTSPQLVQKDKSLPNSGLCISAYSKPITKDNWQQVLQEVQQELGSGRCVDPETAFQLVEQVVDHGEKDHFRLAENLYFTALEAEGHKAKSTLVQQEVRKIIPLLSPEQQKKWKEKLQSNDTSLLQDALSFWKLQDPVLSSSSNERLLEHWSRLSHARKSFTKNTDSIYKTDDRGTIFVKYGKPTYKRTGMLSPSNTEIRSKLYDLSTFKGGIGPREMFNLNMSIKQQYLPRYYEVWVYRNLDTRQPALFIFGESAEKNTFGLRKSVEEFIPRNAFRMGISSSWQFDTGARGLSAGPFIQMGLYNALSTIDIYFGKQLTEYDQNWLQYMRGQLDFSSLKMMNRRERAERELKMRQDQAPPSQSSLQRNLNYVEQEFFTYRFLDSNFRPLTKILIFSQADPELIKTSNQLYGHLKPGYSIKQFAMLIDRNAKVVHFDRDETPISLTPEADSHFGVMLEIPSSRISNSSSGEKLLVGSEVNRRSDIDSEAKEVSIIASGSDRIKDIETLAVETQNFLVSDIVWGFRDKQKNHKIPYLDFHLTKTGVIPQGENFMMYFETYRPTSDPDSLFNYQIDYSIHRVRKEKLIDTDIELTLNFKMRGTKSTETLEVKTSDLKAGTYRIICRFRPEGERGSTTRTVEFEIHDEQLAHSR